MTKTIYIYYIFSVRLDIEMSKSVFKLNMGRKKCEKPSEYYEDCDVLYFLMMKVRTIRKLAQNI